MKLKIKKILDDYLKDLTNVVNIQSVYILGSLAVGEFDDESSDIDLLVIINQMFTKDEYDMLDQLHKKIRQINNRTRLEVSYITSDLVVSDYGFNRLYYNSKLRYEKTGPEWIFDKLMLKESGILIYGKKVDTYLINIKKEDIKNAAKDILFDDIIPLLEGPELNKEYSIFLILTICRIYYTLKTGETKSKKYSSDWAIKRVSNEYSEIITKAKENNYSGGLYKFYEYMMEKMNNDKIT